MAKLKNHQNFWLRDDAAAAFDDAERDHGLFQVNSAGRYEWEQQQLIDRWNKGGAANRPPYLYEPARPAKSSYHVKDGGIAVDLADWRRFATICANYGFVHRYPSSDPVHFEFVGRKGASTGFNQDVQNRQNWLISRGYNLGPSGADGIAGQYYTQAVKQYQTFLKAYGYTGDIDGRWGPGTQTAHQKYYDEVMTVNQELKNQQAWLISRGYDLGPTGADGRWGAATERAFKQYQEFLKAYGYTGDIDGRWGRGTQAAHERYYAFVTAPPSGTPNFPLPAGKYFGPEAGGDNSISGWHSYTENLKQWQQRMADRGWPITVDGKYGPKGAKDAQGNTYEVALAFQKEKGLEADGLIGPDTWKAAWEAPVTPAPPIPAPPVPVPDPEVTPAPDDEIKATPNLITPSAEHFPKWIRFEIVGDPDGAAQDLNKRAAEYYGVPYNPVESHLHWWGKPGEAGTHDGNVNHIKNTKDLSVNFVVSERRITLMVPINKLAFTTGKRNPYGWKSENDPTLSDWQYKTMGYLHYIVEKLNPSLLNEPLRHHKEFMQTSCSEIDKAKVRYYAEAFRTGTLDPATGLPPEKVEPTPTPEPEPEVPSEDMVLVPRKLLDLVKSLPSEFRALAADFEDLTG